MMVEEITAVGGDATAAGHLAAALRRSSDFVKFTP
jgi:hypothetical protein